MSEWWLRSFRVLSVVPSCLAEVLPAHVVRGLGAGVQRLGCFRSRQCARSQDRRGRQSSVHGLRTGVDVRAAAPEFSSRGVLSLPAGADGSSARVVRGLEVSVSCCVLSVFATFPYKLVVWVLGISLNIP
jgi:hypothetical protein